jgi:branched-chain amino acid aminotransferase
VYGRRPFQLDEHLDRLARSAAALRIRLPRSRDQIAGDIDAVVGRNALADCVIRVAVSRGVGRRGPSIEGADQPTYVVSAGPLPPDLSERRARGVALAVVGTRRVSSKAVPTSAKHANYLNSILAFADAADQGFDDALLLGASGEIAECSGANVFLVTNSSVLTPHLAADILPGCVRAHVLFLCRRNGIALEERRLDPQDLDAAGEVFVTNSVVEILPVRAIGAHRFPAPGPVTARLIELYHASVVEDLRDS